MGKKKGYREEDEDEFEINNEYDDDENEDDGNGYVNGFANEGEYDEGRNTDLTEEEENAALFEEYGKLSPEQREAATAEKYHTVFHSSSESAISEALKGGYEVAWATFQMKNSLSSIGEETITLEHVSDEHASSDLKKLCNVNQIYIVKTKNNFPVTINGNFTGIKGNFVKHTSGAKPSHFSVAAGDSTEYRYSRPCLATRTVEKDSFLESHPTLEIETVGKMVTKIDDHYLSKKKSPLHQYMKNNSNYKGKYKLQGQFISFSPDVKESVMNDLENKLQNRHFTTLDKIKLQVSRNLSSSNHKSSVEKPTNPWLDPVELKISSNQEENNKAYKVLTEKVYNFAVEVAIIYQPVTN
jgi:hypothetical protein